MLMIPLACVFPFGVALFMFLAIVVSYAIAVAKHHEAPFWPYISDGAVAFPESNIFAEFLDLSALAAFCSFCVRLQILRDALQNEERRWTVVSFVAFFIGLGSVAGMTLVGNFQEDKQGHVHLAGAALLFVLGTLYACVDSILSLVMYRITASLKYKISCIVRFVIAGLSAVFIILTISGKFSSEAIWNNNHPGQNATDRINQQRFWSKNDTGYDIHVLGSASEWAVGFLFIFYFVTFIWEFSKYDCRLRVRPFDNGEANERQPLVG